MSQGVNDSNSTIAPGTPPIDLRNMRNLSEANVALLNKTPFKPRQEESLYSSKHVHLTKFIFEDAKGNQKSAEGVQRRHFNGNQDDSSNISTIAILRRHILCDCLVLVKQYRPALKGYTLEFPAKIIEHANEQPADQAAIEELRDDTGYRSMVVKHISPETAQDPDLSDEKLKLVTMEVDGDDPIKNYNGSSNGNNKDKHPEIEVIQVPINGLLDRLNEFSKNNIILDSKVYAFAIGLKKGEKLALAKFANSDSFETPI